MNHQKFIDLIPYQILKDIWKEDTLIHPPDPKSFKTIQENDFFLTLYEISVNVHMYVIPEIPHIVLLTYINETISKAPFDNDIKQFLTKNFVFILLLVLLVNNGNRFKVYSVQCQNLFGMRIDLKDPINQYLFDIHKNIWEEMSPKNKNIQAVSIELYSDVLYILKFIYSKLFEIDMNKINYAISDLGVMPSYWPISYKLRIRLIGSLRNSNLIFNGLDILKRKHSRLYAVQNRENLYPLTTDEIIFLYKLAQAL